MSNNLIELRLKREALHKRLDLVNHQIDEAVERQLDNETDGIFLNNEQLHKLLAYLEHTIVSDEDLNDQNRKKLMKYSYGLSWDIADKLGYNINEGTINPTNFEFEEFTFNK